MKNDTLRETLLDIAAMEIDFPVTDEILSEMAAEVDAIPDEHWYWCTFRESYLICLYGNADVNNKKDMYWLPYAENCTKIKKLCEEFIFPMTTVRPRIIIIRTMPGMVMRHHTDCNADQIKNLEPKLRLVLKGRKKNTLYYINENNDHVHISEEWRGYIMSGAALHGMANTGGDKYTLCWGDPWTGDNLENEKFIEYITDQISKHKENAITISSLGNVDHVSGVKNTKVEKIYSWNEWHNRQKN